MKDILIAIPAYNEEKSIRSVIRNCFEYGDVLVLNDCSSDQTQEICEEEACEIIKGERNVGYSLTIDEAVKYAHKQKYEILLFIDGDGQHPTESIPDFISSLKGGYSAAVGDRGNMIQRPIEKLSSHICNIFFGIHDVYCGMKGFKLTDYPYEKIEAHDNCFGLVHIFDYYIDNLDIKNIEINCEKRLYGNSRLGVSELKNNLQLLRGLIMAICIAYTKNIIYRWKES
ncbi:glycosyltransferase [Synechococcus sp. YX-04-1]|uniref:glycosyltransferase n=1 Tax=Synechococcus sp. YX-04-1 TaxID=3062778 RepID=UPI0026E1B180|nr:glycosyltransferase [Synechococcus sp. YX-04-1]MDO6351098.1 glycosyltransferase [Synechococcus sp. YX-04-1]